MEDRGNMDTMWVRVHCWWRGPRYQKGNVTNVQNNSATNQLITYFSDCKRLKIKRLYWNWVVKKKKRKQLLLDVFADIHHVTMEIFKARKSVRQGLSTDYLSMAENIIIQPCQKERFNGEIYALMPGNPVRRSSPIYRLNPSLKMECWE